MVLECDVWLNVFMGCMLWCGCVMLGVYFFVEGFYDVFVCCFFDVFGVVCGGCVIVGLVYFV